jgi:Ion channel
VGSGVAHASAGPFGEFQEMRSTKEDRRALILLVSLAVFLLLSPFVPETHTGEIVFVLALYLTFVAATMELSAQSSYWRSPLILGVCSLAAFLAALYHPNRTVMITQWALMSAFLACVSVVLFVQLGRPGKITAGHLYLSVSVYLLLGILYFAMFNLLDAIHPGSLALVGSGPPGTNEITRYSHLYFSLATLTTLGYGDIVPVTRSARMLSVLEAATGVLYIAITVARLVAAYQGPREQD